MLETYLTEIRTYNDETKEHETWAGPDILARSKRDALFLLDFLKMYHVHIIGIKVGEIDWDN